MEKRLIIFSQRVKIRSAIASIVDGKKGMISQRSVIYKQDARDVFQHRRSANNICWNHRGGHLYSADTSKAMTATAKRNARGFALHPSKEISVRRSQHVPLLQKFLFWIQWDERRTRGSGGGGGKNAERVKTRRYPFYVYAKSILTRSLSGPFRRFFSWLTNIFFSLSLSLCFFGSIMIDCEYFISFAEDFIIKLNYSKRIFPWLHSFKN